MATDVIEVVIDERKRLDRMDSNALLRLRAATAYGSQKRVFKDYILSSEVYYLDPDTN